jgi:hypothetical protein
MRHSFSSVDGYFAAVPLFDIDLECTAGNDFRPPSPGKQLFSALDLGEPGRVDDHRPALTAALKVCEYRIRSHGRLVKPVWAITLFPRGFDQVIPQVLALFLF